VNKEQEKKFNQMMGITSPILSEAKKKQKRRCEGRKMNRKNGKPNLKEELIRKDTSQFIGWNKQTTENYLVDLIDDLNS
jgi:hypothetical protein